MIETKLRGVSDKFWQLLCATWRRMRGNNELLATVSRLLCDPLAISVASCRKTIAVQWDRGFTVWLSNDFPVNYQLFMINHEYSCEISFIYDQWLKNLWNNITSDKIRCINDGLGWESDNLRLYFTILLHFKNFMNIHEYEKLDSLYIYPCDEKPMPNL